MTRIVPRFTTAVLFAAMFLAQACSDDEKATVAEDDYCREVVQAVCGGFLSCCSSEGMPAYASRSECITTETKNCDDELSAALKPTVEFDPAAAAEIVNSLGAAANGCRPLPEHEVPVNGIRKEREACVDSDDCGSGLWCQGLLCVRPGRAGDGCNPVGLPCEAEADLICQPLLAGQAPAAAVSTGPQVTGTCTSLPRAGQPCSGQCAGGLMCALPTPAVAGATTTCRSLAGNGSACSTALECGSRFCKDPPAPAVAQGGVAAAGAAAAAVPAGKTCGACEKNRDCAASGEYRLCADGQCSLVKDGSLEETDACTDDAECKSNYCMAGVCVSPTQDELYCKGGLLSGGPGDAVAPPVVEAAGEDM